MSVSALILQSRRFPVLFAVALACALPAVSKLMLPQSTGRVELLADQSASFSARPRQIRRFRIAGPTETIAPPGSPIAVQLAAEATFVFSYTVRGSRR